jgi:hypothetical protein
MQGQRKGVYPLDIWQSFVEIIYDFVRDRLKGMTYIYISFLIPFFLL